MRKVLLSLVLLFTLACPAFAKFEAQQDMCVRVDVDGGCGSGVVVTREVSPGVTRSFVWTAAHVVIGLRDNEGKFKNAVIYQEKRENGKLTGVSKVEAKVIAFSDPERGHDLALLEVLQDNYKPLAVSATFDLSGLVPEVGTEMLHVGSPRGLFNSCSLGIMSQTDRDILETGMMFDQTTVMGYPGSSGGAVFNLASGQVQGLLVRGIGPGLNFIVPARRIITFADSMQLRWAIDPTVAFPSAEDRAKLPLDDGLGAKPKVERIGPSLKIGGDIIRLIICVWFGVSP